MFWSKFFIIPELLWLPSLAPVVDVTAHLIALLMLHSSESAQMGQCPSRVDEDRAFKILSLLVSERLRVGHPYVISISRGGRGCVLKRII